MIYALNPSACREDRVRLFLSSPVPPTGKEIPPLYGGPTAGSQINEAKCAPKRGTKQLKTVSGRERTQTAEEAGKAEAAAVNCWKPIDDDSRREVVDVVVVPGRMRTFVW